MIRAEAEQPLLLERAAAEAFAAGAAGLQEHDQPPALEIYVRSSSARAVRAALAPLQREGLRVALSVAVEAVDWSARWRDGLEAVVISERLVVRPSFVARPPGDAPELLIDPGQAFGTGSHGSTRRVLEWLDRFALEGRLSGVRVLDVGCGTGVLALAALRLGAEAALGFDLDPLAAAAARANARINGLEERFRSFVGPLDTVRGRFDLVVANLLRREMVPILDGLAAHLAPAGVLLLSGLLGRDEASVARLLAERDLSVCGSYAERDACGDSWLGLRVERQRLPRVRV